MTKYKTIKYCIFDVDGLLLDTETIYTEVTSEILKRYGKEFTWKVKAGMMGKKAREAAEYLINELQIDLDIDDYLKERSEMHEKLFPFCKKMPGALDLIKNLKAKNIPIAVATSSNKNAFAQKSQNHKDMFDLFDCIVTGDNENVKQGKPSPDIFQEAARQLNVENPEDCLVFEDAPSGVQAGINANMSVVWVPDPRLEIDEKISGNEKVEMLSSLENFKPENWGIPSF